MENNTLTPKQEMTKEDIFDVIRQQAADGADFMTIHCGINRYHPEGIQLLKKGT